MNGYIFHLSDEMLHIRNLLEELHFPRFCKPACRTFSTSMASRLFSSLMSPM